MKKIERIGRMVLIVAVVAVGLLFWGPYKRFSVSVVLSGSMEPALKTGGLIFTDIKEVTPEKGDIIPLSPESVPAVPVRDLHSYWHRLLSHIHFYRWH